MYITIIDFSMDVSKMSALKRITSKQKEQLKVAKKKLSARIFKKIGESSAASARATPVAVLQVGCSNNEGECNSIRCKINYKLYSQTSLYRAT